MLYIYEERPIGFEFLGALEVGINFQTSDFDYKVVIKIYTYIYK